MKGKEILNFVDMEDEDASSEGLLVQRMFAIRKKVSLPPMFVLSSSIFRDLMEENEIPDRKHISWKLELEIASGFNQLESPVVRILPSPSYEFSAPPISLVKSKSELVVGIDALFRSYFDLEETKKRQEIGVHDFSVAAVVQKLIDAKCSGQLTQTKKDARFTAVHGLPMHSEGIDSYVVDNEGNVTSYSEAEQQRKWILGEKDVELEDIDEDYWDSEKLTEKQVSRLASLGRKVLEIYGEPITIEWYLVRNTFYVASVYPTKIEFVGT